MSDSHDHGKRKNKSIVPQKELGTALRGFFDHVVSHDEEGVHAAICMVANASDEKDTGHGVPMHVCSFGAGDPNTLAQIMISTIDTAIEEVPGFEQAWATALQARRLKSLLDNVVNVVKEAKEKAEEEQGMAQAKPEVDALLEKLKGNPGAVPGTDTKH